MTPTPTRPYRPVDVEPNTLDWLRWRQGGLGASDAPPILGLSPWTSPRDVWLSKTSDTISDEQTEAMEFGHVLEPVILEQLAKRHGDPDNDRHRYIGQIMPGGAYESIEFPHLLASFDGLVLEDGADDAVPLQIKNVSPYKTKAWDDAELGVPDEVAVQVYQECIVRGVDHGYAAAFFGNRLPEPIRLDVPADYRDWYIETSAAWWDKHVLQGIEPDPTLLDDLSSIWQAVMGESHDLTDDELLALDELVTVREKIATLETREAELKLRLQTGLGEATEGWDRRGSLLGRLAVTWRPHKQAREKFYRDELLADHPEVADLLASYTRRDGAIPRPFLVK